MNGWMRHRPALIVGGAFLLAAFVLWVGWMRGWGRAYARDRRARETAELRRQKEFGEGPAIQNVRRELEAANAALAEAYDAEAKRRLYTFAGPFAPPPGQSSSFFLQTKLNDLEAQFNAQVVNRCSISVADDIPRTATAAYKSLGFEVPTVEEGATAELVALRMRQFAVMDRFRALLVAVHDRARGVDGEATRNVRPIESIRALAAQFEPMEVGHAREPNLLRSYSLETTLRLSLPALTALLELADSPEHFHVVRRLDIQWASDGGTPPTRASQLEARPGEPRETITDSRRTVREFRRYIHYYDVKLELATLTAVETVLQVAPAPTQGGGGRTTGGGGRTGGPRTRLH